MAGVLVASRHAQEGGAGVRPHHGPQAMEAGSGLTPPLERACCARSTTPMRRRDMRSRVAAGHSRIASGHTGRSFRGS